MKYYIKYIIQRCISFCLLPFYLCPVKKNRVLFLCIEGGSTSEYSCNPRAVCEYMESNYPQDYELVWLFKEPKRYSNLSGRYKMAKHFTIKGVYYALTSKVVITNGGYLAWFPFRKSQICINTWHGGGAYKRLENDTSSANKATAKRMKHHSKKTTAFISSGKRFSEDVIKGAFLYDGTILDIGMPRNDIFFSEKKDTIRAELKKQYSIPEDAKCILYAPTFRDSLTEDVMLSAKNILDTLSKHSDDNWYILYRSHTKASEPHIIKDVTSHCIDVSGYDETQSLLCAADWLISDYSSVIWDYTLLDRPLFLYTPDVDSYISAQGFYVDIDKWQIPMCKNMEEAITLIPEILSGSHMDAAKNHRTMLGSYENGHGSENLVRYIREAIQ